MKKIAVIITGMCFVMSAVHATAEDIQYTDILPLCEGKAPHVKVSTQLNGRTLQGSCQIGFKPHDPQNLKGYMMHEPALQNACKGKARTSTVVIHLAGKKVPGKCDLVFKINRRLSI